MTRTRYDFWVGIFVLLGILAFAFLALKVSSGTGSGLVSARTYHIDAIFKDIGGLKVRASVRSAGVVVGRVSSIRLDPKTYNAVVSLELNSDYQFSTDSGAEILTSGILGDQYIGLTPGGAEENLQNGDRITFTQPALVLEKLIQQFVQAFLNAPPKDDKNKAVSAPKRGNP